MSPGQRYGHTMVFSKPYLVVFGGNSGNRAQNDVWLLNITKGPFSWTKYEFPAGKPAPCPRVYHSAAICQEGSAMGMMVVFGGRRQNNRKDGHHNSQRQLSVSAMNDVWGLRKHRDGSWDWVTPPKSQTYTPLSRYQHLVTFMGSSLVIVGGRSSFPEESVATIEIYDTETSEWTRINSVSRYRHASVLYNKSKLFVHGGFEPEMVSQPLESMVCVDLVEALAKKNQSQLQQPLSLTGNSSISAFSRKQQYSQHQQLQSGTHPNLNHNQPQLNQLQTQSQPQNRFIPSQQPLRQFSDSERNVPSPSNTSSAANSSRIRPNQKIQTLGRSRLDRNNDRSERDLTPSRIINSSKSIRLSNQVVVAKSDNPQQSIQIQKMNVNDLMEESKKLTTIHIDDTADGSMLDLIDNVIAILMPTTLNNKQTKNPNFNIFPFKRDKVIRLCQETAKLLVKEGSLIGVRAPAKIFGSLYGRFQDLLNMFENFGYPDQKQMQTFEYVFLGNYVGKGFNSLETICLLMALKIKFPDHIRLLRGRYEDSVVNRACGFAEECSLRLNESIAEPTSVFNLINSVFELMPLAAAVQDNYLCLNGGLGSIRDLVLIKDIVRPAKVKNDPKVMELLWSQLDDKNSASHLLGYKACEKCPQNELEQFLDKNGLQMLINTKDGLKSGCEDDGPILSINTITNYGNSTSKGCILKITKQLQVAPCIVSSLSKQSSPWVTQLSTKVNIGLTENEVSFRRVMFSN